MPILRPNAEAVAAKVIDGEAIIMNLTTGAYYSMDGTGAAVWEMIEQGRSVDSLGPAIATRYSIDPALALQDVERLVQELMTEGLVVHSEGGDTAAVTDDGLRSEAYRPPVLNKYTEMADLLALDPPMPALPTAPPRAE